MLRQRPLKTFLFCSIIGILWVTVESMESLLIFNVSFTLTAYYGLLRCPRRFSNSFSILMMFSIDFENDLVLLHSRAIPVFHFIDV